MERATIHDFSRMCKSHKDCKFCDLSVNVNGLHITCCNLLANHPNKASEIILKWCEEHPIKTRQSEFMKMFPNAKIDNCGTLILCPRLVDKGFKCNRQLLCCTECCKKYWLAEVDDGEQDKE